jgi:hypothetical protein
VPMGLGDGRGRSLQYNRSKRHCGTQVGYNCAVGTSLRSDYAVAVAVVPVYPKHRVELWDCICQGLESSADL